MLAYIQTYFISTPEDLAALSACLVTAVSFMRACGNAEQPSPDG
jgi:hypothetical protein